MSSTFLGLQTARSAIAASQIALEVTGQNIANVNTDDYTRQSADLVSVNYSSGVSKFAQPASSNIGQGVGVLEISQIRDAFLDARVRNVNSQTKAIDTVLSALSEVQGILDETKTDGLHDMLNDFYNQLESLSNNVGNVEYAAIVRSSAEKVAQVFNQYASQLSQIKEEQSTSFESEVEQLNSTIGKINTVNALIKDQTVRGSVSNELLDMRNSYLDTLSGMINITVSQEADGSVKVTSEGDIDVLDSTFAITQSGDQMSIQRTDTGGADESFSPSGGTISGYLDVINGAGSFAESGESDFRGIIYYERALDAFAEAFAGTFNDLNTLDSASPADLFTGSTAADISISGAWREDAEYIVVADESTNDNIIKMINAMDEDIDDSLYPGVSGTFEGFARTLINDNAVDVGYFGDMSKMNNSILSSAISQRESVMGVSIDEETINMTKYQKAYQAAARLMTVMDENLDTLIHSMGIVGR